MELRGLALSAGSGQRASLPVEPMAFLDGFYPALEGDQAPDLMDDLEQAVSIVDYAVTRQGLSLQFDAGKTEAVVCSEDAASSFCFTDRLIASKQGQGVDRVATLALHNWAYLAHRAQVSPPWCHCGCVLQVGPRASPSYHAGPLCRAQVGCHSFGQKAGCRQTFASTWLQGPSLPSLRGWRMGRHV